MRTRECGESDGCRDTYLWFLSVAGAGEGDRYVSKRLAGIEKRTRRRGGATHSLDSPVGTSGDNDRHRPPLVLCETLPHDLLDLTGLLSLGDVVVAVAEGERGEGKTSSAQRKAGCREERTYLSKPSAFFMALSTLAMARLCFRALASATFRIGRASSARCLARRASTASFVIGTFDL